ncbi:hypothetical protein NicSoilB4_16720 [Arthrobacter sp. NicSoilB4]|nr:hypothetical protein NicSoilB4_16720 [Arthrobacter sp. NicSoilB4]
MPASQCLPPARMETRPADRVSTQTLAEVSSTYRIIGPSTKGEVVMTQLYLLGPGCGHGLAEMIPLRFGAA